MNPKTHYTPTKDGFAISGSLDIFNKLLYGSHQNDDKEARFSTFAGDLPMVMGAATDWTVYDWCDFGKRGVFASGLALTPGHRRDGAYDGRETGSKWFHEAYDVISETKDGWVEYTLSDMGNYFPEVTIKMEVYPLLPDDGYLVHYHITTDQRVFFTAAFGGVTEYFGRFERPGNLRRLFSALDCKGNTVEIGKNRACVKHTDGTTMWVGTSFDAAFAEGSAKAMETVCPSLFLGSKPENEDDRVVKISAEIKQGDELDGFFVAIHNADEATLDKWLAMEDPMSYVKQQIIAKHACINMSTPENPLDLTIAPTVVALDASFHRNSFHHGTFAYHSPFLGWRAWYAPSALGWNDKVQAAMVAHLDEIVKTADGKERVWFDGTQPREGDGMSPYHCIENTYGYMPYFLGLTLPYYNMQECGFDMMMHYFEWSGQLEVARKYFDDMCMLLDYEDRIFDPDNDGLYQNFLNTWISDGHSYHGAGCAQSSAYNYRANMAMAKIARKLGLSDAVFVKRAEKIKAAINDKLWLANSGVIAESLDTMGNCMIHPSPELNTTYLVIDCEAVDDFRAYTMLKYTENYIESITTQGQGGRLCYSSNWGPRKYSTRGLFPSENSCLALAYYQLGLKEKGKEILDGLVDCYFTGRNPGTATHVQSNLGGDSGDWDFTDTTSTYLRLVVEGLFGIRFKALDDTVTIAPNFPEDWDHASLTLKDISLTYTRKGAQEIFDICTDRTEQKVIKLPMLAAEVEMVMLDGQIVPYTVKAGVNNSFIEIKTDKVGRFQLRVLHGKGTRPTLSYSAKVLEGNQVVFEVQNGRFAEYMDISEALEDISVVGNKVYAKVKAIAGWHTLFIRVKSGKYDGWLAADYEVLVKETPEEPLQEKPFTPVDISKFFNCKLTEIHQQEYLSPRPDAYSIGVFPNGRYAWEWNHYGHNGLFVDDSALRNAGGVIHTDSGIPFATPAENENVACVSLWDNFPTEMAIPLDGKAQELAILFASTTNEMQTAVENVRITVEYADGTTATTRLIFPLNIDDWLVPALQKESETFYFSEFNHATVQRIRLDPTKALANVKIEAIANEVIMGVMGVSISR